MSDYLVNFGANPSARKLVKTLGIPVPLPQKLDRAKGALSPRPLEGKTVWTAVAGPCDEAVHNALAAAIPALGAQVVLLGPGIHEQPWAAAAEAYGRPLESRPEPAEGKQADAFVLDATGVRTVADLRDVYSRTQPVVRSLRRTGRIVVVHRPPHSLSEPEAVAMQRALPGLVKSLAKELGGKGITANLVAVHPGAEDCLAGPVSFFLSRRSAFITGQTLTVSCQGGQGATWTARPLDGKVAVVTGSARGIGKATATRLAEEGARVVLVDRPADGELLGEVARAVGGTALALDVTDPTAGEQLVAALGERGADVVVHNAGVTRDKTLGRMDADRWDLVVAVNLDAILRIEAALDAAGSMQPGGRTIVMSSIGGLAGNMGQTNYAATKAALVGWVSAEAPRRSPKNQTVNAIAPGFIETRMTDAIPVATREGARRLSALSQGGLPVDIAEAIVFLASDCAGGITGRTLRVCGGNLIGA